LFLRKGQNNMINVINDNKRHKLNRPITGIIQKDRIWEQWYDPSIFSRPLPKMSQKDYLFSQIGDDKERVIINNRGMKQFTVAEFQKMVVKFEKAFAAMKLKKGDVICTIGLTTPEMYAIKYSATSLGLITCNVNVFDVGIEDNGKSRLFRQMENVEPRMIFTLDILEDKVYHVVNEPEFSEAVKVSMPLERSTPKYNPERAAIYFKTLTCRMAGKRIKNQISLDEFLKSGKAIDINDVEEVYEEGLPCNISFTSGTTGINKAVLLSHDANNALAFQHLLGDFGFTKGSKNLALVPPFLAFWDADIVHTVMCLGGEEILELYLDYEKIPQYFKKYDVNIGVWSQYLWSSILNLKQDEIEKVSRNLINAIVGGERCEVNAAERFYDKTGVFQMTGFGASEVNTAFTLTHPNCRKMGTSGIPLPFNNVKIVDDSMKDATYNVPGRLLITGPCLMNGYYKRKDLTDKVIFVDDGGISWYCTGDYAVMDDDGCLTVLDRYIPPVEIRTGSQKEMVNMLDIVEVIKKDRNIKNCKMTYHDGKLVFHLSLDDFTGLSYEDAVDSILGTIKHYLPGRHFPDFIIVYDELPRTAVGKVEYGRIKEIGEKCCRENGDGEKLVVVKY